MHENGLSSIAIGKRSEIRALKYLKNGKPKHDQKECSRKNNKEQKVAGTVFLFPVSIKRPRFSRLIKRYIVRKRNSYSFCHWLLLFIETAVLKINTAIKADSVEIRRRLSECLR